LSAELQSRIRRIEKELEEKGDTKEVRRKFWRLVGRIKRGDFPVNEETIEEITKIRERLFKKRVILSTTKGAVLFPSSFLISMLLFCWINVCAQSLSPSSFTIHLPLLLSESLVLYFGFLTGKLLGGAFSGIKFDGFFRYSPLEFGVKVNYKSYLLAGAWKRVALYGTTISFQVAVMSVLVLIVYKYNADAVLLPIAFLFFWLFGSFVMHLKARTGELHRFLRELKIAIELRGKEKKLI